MTRILLLLVMACSLAAGCTESETAREERAMRAAVPQRLLPDGSVRLTETDRGALRLVVAAAELGDLPGVSVRYGQVRVRPGDEGVVVAPSAGRIARAPFVELGEQVKRGAPVLVFAPVVSAAERVAIGTQGAQLGGDIAAAERELEKDETDARRAQKLSESNLISASELQAAETQAARTRAQLEGLRQARTRQSADQASMTLRAPVAGTVASLETSVGAVVNMGDLLARILRPGPRWIDVAVPPDEPPGADYELASGQDWVPAYLVAQGAVVERDGTRHDRLEVAPSVAGRFVPGAIVAVRIARGTSHGILVPESALVPGVGADLVYVETTPGVFAPRSVRVAARFGGKARIESGLQPGETIVVRGAMGLRGETLRSELRHED